MNNDQASKTDKLRSLEILDALSDNEALTQRDLSKRLGIALGLVNTYMKNLVTKGYIKVTSLPPNKYIYLLTPKGMAEKGSLTYQLLKDYTRIYREARGALKALFSALDAQHDRRIVFAGTDEIAEIAYISLQETSLELSHVVDSGAQVGKKFFGHTIHDIDSLKGVQYDRIVVTSYYRRQEIRAELESAGIDPKRIMETFTP